MKYVYFDGSSGLSGDMILGALLDLGVSPVLFRKKMAGLRLPVSIRIYDTRRASLRGLKVDVLVKKESPERRWSDVERLIRKSPFSPEVRRNALAVFRALFEAEAKVHGRPFSQAHLHEAAADDAIIDVVGACFLAETLEVKAFYSSPLNVGQGWVKTSHGVFPVPPPAVAELLKNIPVYSAWVKEEMVTPTGAALAATLVEKFLEFPEITYRKVGCGAGGRNFPDFANILRVFYGDIQGSPEKKRIYVIEANIDDANPQLIAHFLETSLALGALDAFLTPIVMKKNRLGTKLTVLAEPDRMDALIRSIFQETSSIGVRYFPVERKILERTVRKVKVLGTEVGIKISHLDGREVNIQPEFSDCVSLARKKAKPVKEVIQLALKEILADGRKGAAAGKKE